ncbi:trigger factor [Wenzhouxiangella sp. AB-CW3]|uniref:trigger factor n=1 Tax=Wenzhouxiangella sp. AB-CW3 TaxID=2771012 RepID=UPI00168BB2F1|nr:trigger factor [Wenzhouxiangella sp. AB-CW3]QOC21524.1 trigger factor [Wenzhouxiangella sp. AB-CW3]
MQVSVEKTGDLERRMTVQVPADSIDSKVSGRLNELRRQVRLKGFRPGRVPMNIIRKRYGDQVREEVLQQVMQSSLEEAIGEQSFRVAGVSSLQPTPPADGGDFEFTAELEVFPEIPELDVSDMDIERPKAEITDSDVDDMIETLRQQRISFKEVDRGAAEGDRVSLGYVAQVDGERVPEQGEHEIAPVMGQLAAFPALEEALAGVKGGEEKDIELTFPDNYGYEALAGKTAQVQLTVKTVEESELPEVDESFAEAFGIEGGVEELRDGVRKNLEREMRQAVNNRLRQVVTDGLGERFSDLPVPASRVSQEVQQLQAQLKQQTGQQPPAAEKLRASAEQRVRLGMLLGELARQNNIEIDPARVQARIEEVAETYDQPSEVIELYRSEPHLMDQIENVVLEDQVIDWVLENAKVEDKEMTFRELMGRE